MTEVHVGENCFGEYRGHHFRVKARRTGDAWAGQFRLLGIGEQQAQRAAEDGRHQWTPIDPGWATQPEAVRNARQAAHAAIDALTWQAQLPVA